MVMIVDVLVSEFELVLVAALELAGVPASACCTVSVSVSSPAGMLPPSLEAPMSPALWPLLASAVVAVHGGHSKMHTSAREVPTASSLLLGEAAMHVATCCSSSSAMHSYERISASPCRLALLLLLHERRMCSMAWRLLCEALRGMLELLRQVVLLVIMLLAPA